MQRRLRSDPLVFELRRLYVLPAPRPNPQFAIGINPSLSCIAPQDSKPLALLVDIGSTPSSPILAIDFAGRNRANLPTFSRHTLLDAIFQTGTGLDRPSSRGSPQPLTFLWLLDQTLDIAFINAHTQKRGELSAN